MRGGRIVAALVAAALATVTFAACDDSPTPNPTSSATVSESATPAPTPTDAVTPSPSPTSDEEIASANAEKAVHAYYASLDRLGANPALSLDALADVATSIVLDSDTQMLTRWRRDGWVQSGPTRLVAVDLVDVSLDNSDPDSGRVPVVQFDVCYDISDADVVDADGSSIIPADQPLRGWERLTVGNYEWDSNPTGAWRVSSAETLEREPCDAD